VVSSLSVLFSHTRPQSCIGSWSCWTRVVWWTRVWIILLRRLIVTGYHRTRVLWSSCWDDFIWTEGTTCEYNLPATGGGGGAPAATGAACEYDLPNSQSLHVPRYAAESPPIIRVAPAQLHRDSLCATKTTCVVVTETACVCFIAGI